MSLLSAISRKAGGNLLKNRATSFSTPVLSYHPNVSLCLCADAVCVTNFFSCQLDQNPFSVAESG
jgi:hypothetical protein